MRKVKICFFWFLFIAGVFILIEMPFRIYDYAFRYKGIKTHLEQKEKIDVPFGEMETYFFKTGICVRDPYVIWRYVKTIGDPPYKFNSLGIRTRGGQGLAKIKPEDVYRIIVIGGSHPFGARVGYEGAYPHQLEKLFESKSTPTRKRVEVINAAVPGYSSLQALHFLKYYLLEYNPDFLIVDVGTNDCTPLPDTFPWSDKELVPLNPFLCGVGNIAQRSSFFWYFKVFWKERISQFRKNGSGVENRGRVRVPQEDTLEYLQQIKTIAQERGFGICFISQVFLSVQGELLHRENIKMLPYVDIYEELKAADNIEGFFLDAIHGSRKGHKKIAEIIYTYLQTLDLPLEREMANK